MLHNFSQVAREIDYDSKAIFKDIGNTLAQGVWEHFVVLVNETAQYTGTTAASWNLSMGGDQSVREQPERTKSEALQKGHQAAVGIAIGHNFKSLVDITEKYKYSAVVIENHALGAERSESGPLRDVNSPTGAFAKFQMNLANATFEIIRSRNR